MRVEIREGGDGVRCWNREAVLAYAAGIDQVQERIGRANPDVEVIDGLVRCYGCEVQEYHYGTKCTAVLTRTLYAVRGQIAPRAEDAAGSPAEIDGLLLTEPGSAGLGSHNAPVEAAVGATDEATGGRTTEAAAGVPSPERRLAQEPPDREPRRRGLFRR